MIQFLIETVSHSGAWTRLRVSLCSCALSVWEFLVSVVRQVIFGRLFVSSLMGRERNSELWGICFPPIENVRFQQQVVYSPFHCRDTYKGDSSSHSRHFCHTRQHTAVVLETRSTQKMNPSRQIRQQISSGVSKRSLSSLVPEGNLLWKP